MRRQARASGVFLFHIYLSLSHTPRASSLVSDTRGVLTFGAHRQEGGILWEAVEVGGSDGGCDGGGGEREKEKRMTDKPSACYLPDLKVVCCFFCIFVHFFFLLTIVIQHSVDIVGVSLTKSITEYKLKACYYFPFSYIFSTTGGESWWGEQQEKKRKNTVNFKNSFVNVFFYICH